MVIWCYYNRHRNGTPSSFSPASWLLSLCWIMIALQQLPVAKGLSSSTSSVLSRMENAQCAIQMIVGRIPGTAMPPEWAASGAKLSLPLELEFCKEPCAEYEMNKERLLGDGNKPSFRAVELLNEPSFISTKGVERVKVTSGAFGCSIERIESQQYSFRFFLDFPEGAVRNDVELPAERIYFLSSCWIADQAIKDRAQQTKEQTEKAWKNTSKELEELNAKSSNFFQKALDLRQMTTLVERRKKLESIMVDIDQSYPLRDELLIEGPNGIVFPKEGTIAVKRFGGSMGSREQYHWVGKFKFEEFFEDEYEDEIP